MMCRGINISVDNRVENKEQFTVTLQSTDTAVQFSSNISTVFIIDSSSKYTIKPILYTSVIIVVIYCHSVYITMRESGHAYTPLC